MCSSQSCEELQAGKNHSDQNKKHLEKEHDDQEQQAKEVLQAGEKAAAAEVLEENTPKNIRMSRRRGGAKMPEGAARYLPTSKPHMDILEEREAKQKEKEARMAKGKASRKKK